MNKTLKIILIVLFNVITMPVQVMLVPYWFISAAIKRIKEIKLEDVRYKGNDDIIDLNKVRKLRERKCKEA